LSLHGMLTNQMTLVSPSQHSFSLVFNIKTGTFAAKMDGDYANKAVYNTKTVNSYSTRIDAFNGDVVWQQDNLRPLSVGSSHFAIFQILDQ